MRVWTEKQWRYACGGGSGWVTMEEREWW